MGARHLLSLQDGKLARTPNPSAPPPAPSLAAHHPPGDPWDDPPLAPSLPRTSPLVPSDLRIGDILLTPFKRRTTGYWYRVRSRVTSLAGDRVRVVPEAAWSTDEEGDEVTVRLDVSHGALGYTCHAREAVAGRTPYTGRLIPRIRPGAAVPDSTSRVASS